MIPSQAEKFFFRLHRICAEMAELASNNKEYEKAINFYKESLAYDETYTQVWGCYSMEHISD